MRGLEAFAVAAWLSCGAASAEPSPPARPAAGPLQAGATEPQKADDVIPFDPKNYPRRTFSEMLRAGPCAAGRKAPELRDVLFSAELVFQGAVRKSPAKRYALMTDWAKGIGDPGAEVKYKEEVTLSERGKVRWLSVPEGLLAFMQMDVQPGDRVQVYLVFVGCVAAEPLFAIDDFEEVDQRGDEAEDLLI